MALFALTKDRNVWLVLLRCNALSGVANIGDIVFRRVHCLRRFKGSLFGGRFPPEPRGRSKDCGL